MPMMPAWPAPDHPSWHDYPDYSHSLSPRLRHALSLIGSNSLDAYRQAVDLVLPYLSAPVVAPQRLRVCYVFATSLAAVGEYSEALVWLDEALELATLLEDSNAVLDLILLRSSLNRALLRIRDAAGDLQIGLALLADDVCERNEANAALKLNFTANLSGFEYYLGNFSEAEALIASARELMHDAPVATLDAATIEWVKTHLHRMRGRPEEAIRASLAAATAYTESGAPISAARAQILVAESAMDYAMLFPADADRNAMLKFARPHLTLASSLAREARDPAGSGMIVLARVRYSRLRRTNENRIAMTENVIRKARKLDDVALLAEAFTVLGDELAFTGEDESAYNIYRQVLAMLDGSDIPTVGVRARRALMVADEWRVAPNEVTDG